eukprot:TRINITY_DN1757_c0_g1_i1.p1 TRINITY_DN1757_c0_g1~~TRINITY_DN1757_c0_g1_i1.p1  ORF type:complete len:247 (+),score=53.24 TRINITY_DN1757_c0_g1_i1:77-817(+)
MIRRPPRSTHCISSAASDVYKRQEVRGTPPNTKDPWSAGIEFLTQNYELITQIDMRSQQLTRGKLQLNQQSMMYATDKWTEYQIELPTSLLQDNEKNAVRYIRFYEIGKDAEYWGGNYGAQFKSEFIQAYKYTKDNDITHYFKPKPIKCLPIHTYFNDGLGDTLFVDGIRQWESQTKFYNCYADYDFNFPYRSKIYEKQGFQVNQCKGEAWNSGSSLNFIGELKGSQVFFVQDLQDQFSTCRQTLL